MQWGRDQGLPPGGVDRRRRSQAGCHLLLTPPRPVGEGCSAGRPRGSRSTGGASASDRLPLTARPPWSVWTGCSTARPISRPGSGDGRSIAAAIRRTSRPPPQDRSRDLLQNVLLRPGGGRWGRWSVQRVWDHAACHTALHRAVAVGPHGSGYAIRCVIGHVPGSRHRTMGPAWRQLSRLVGSRGEGGSYPHPSRAREGKASADGSADRRLARERDDRARSRA